MVNIAVAGIGYVGLSNAVLLAQHNGVIAYDISDEKVAAVNQRRSPIVDAEIEDYLATKPLRLKATTEEAVARGVVGAPTTFVGDHMFFGQDRLDFVEEALHAA